MKSSYDSRRAPWRGIVTNGVGEVEVDGRRFDAGMAEQDLHDAEINALFEQARGEAVAEHRAYASTINGVMDRAEELANFIV